MTAAMPMDAYRRGDSSLTVPVAEQAKPRKVSVTAGSPAGQAIEAH